MEQRVVITGIGILSSLGNSYEELSQASGMPKTKLSHMSRSALYCVLAAKEALEQARFSVDELNNLNAACIAGSSISYVESSHTEGILSCKERINLISPHTIIRSMANSVSANITHVFGLQGRNFSTSPSSATSTHNINHAFELIRAGALDMAVAGGSEEIYQLSSSTFSTLRSALCSHFNDSSECASLPSDKQPDGFLISEGAGILILEALDIARARGATIYGEIIGYSADSEANNTTNPEPEGAGVATVLELIRCLAMLNQGHFARSINIDRLDPEFEGTPVVTETLKQEFDMAISNTFGFSGTDGVMITRRYQ